MVSGSWPSTTTNEEDLNLVAFHCLLNHQLLEMLYIYPDTFQDKQVINFILHYFSKGDIFITFRNKSLNHLVFLFLWNLESRGTDSFRVNIYFLQTHIASHLHPQAPAVFMCACFWNVTFVICLQGCRVCKIWPLQMPIPKTRKVISANWVRMVSTGNQELHQTLSPTSLFWGRWWRKSSLYFTVRRDQMQYVFLCSSAWNYTWSKD